MAAMRVIALMTALFLSSACTVNDQNATRAQGAGVGAALGLGLAALVGGDGDALVVGAAVGGLAGLAAGDAVARKKADYATAEDMIIEERRIAAEQAEEIRLYNASLERDLAKLNRDVADLEVAASQGRIDRADKIQLRERAVSRLERAQQQLVEVNQEITISRKIYQEARRESQPVDLAQWDRRIRELERRRDALAVLIGDFETSTRRVA